jgi:hypothetical protein
MIIQVLHGISPCQVDDFDLSVERSVEGAIHFSPGTTKVLTPGEWDHIQKCHKDLAGKMCVVVDDKSSKAPVKKAVAVTATPKPKTKLGGQLANVAKSDAIPHLEVGGSVESGEIHKDTHRKRANGKLKITSGVKKRKVKPNK